MHKKLFFQTAFVVSVLANITVFGQSKIKDGSVTGTSSLPNSNAILEVESNSKGFLLPRVALSSTATFTPLSAHVAGITVYNTATAGDVMPGYYYNNGAKWVRIADAASADISKDAWVDDAANTMVKLGTQSDGSTARPAGTEMVVKDDGNVGIGTNAPSAKLEVNGNVEIQSVSNVPDETVYKRLSWNTSTKRVETSPDENNVRKNVTISAGSTADIYTLGSSGALGGAGQNSLDIKIQVGNGCGAGCYNKFVATGATVAAYWVLNHIGGMSYNGPPTISRTNNRTLAVTNPLGSGCADGGDATALNYTLFLDGSNTTLKLTNNGNIAKTYTITIEKAFD